MYGDDAGEFGPFGVEASAGAAGFELGVGIGVTESILLLIGRGRMALGVEGKTELESGNIEATGKEAEGCGTPMGLAKGARHKDKCNGGADGLLGITLVRAQLTTQVTGGLTGGLRTRSQNARVSGRD